MRWDIFLWAGVVSRQFKKHHICSMSHYSFNGKLFRESEAVAGPHNRGLRYGDGLFETIRYHNGTLQFADEHFARLWKGMSVLRFDIPKQITPEYFLQHIETLLQKNGHTSGARIRLSVFRGDGGLYDPQNHYPNHLIQSWGLPQGYGGFNSNGLEVGICREVQKSCDVLSNLKHSNFLPYVIASLEAKKQKWNDAIVLNSYGRVCDSTVANIFLVKDAVVATPSLKEGCIAGVMRRQVIAGLEANGYTVEEKEITVEELMNADEVFLTNSIHPMRWVKSAGNNTYGNKLSLEIYNRIITTIS
jgi:branched-chain amino acid aminotransferase